MTLIHKSNALALMANYQQHITMAGNSHSQLTIGRHQVDLCVFANTLNEIIRYRRILLNLGVWKKDIIYDFYSHNDTSQDFHTITITFNLD